MRIRFLVLLLCLTLISQGNIGINAASTFNAAPANLKTFEANLERSLATITCGVKTGVGFFGSYNITQELKNQGTNSIVLTNNSLVESCKTYSTQEVPLSFQGKNYKGKVTSWNTEGSDFATLNTSVAAETLALFDSNWPENGWWVDVAYYVNGFGIVWRSSQVSIVNEKEYILAIDKISPAPVTGGLVFNSQGIFIGVVTSLGLPFQNDLLKVHGAPLQCNEKGGSQNTVTICGGGSTINYSARANVWTIKSGVVPIVSSTAKPASAELTDTILAVEKALNSYNETVSECANFASEVVEKMHNLNIAEKYFDKCYLNDTKAKSIQQKLNAIDRLASANSTLLNQLNQYVDQINKYCEDVDSTYAELQDAELQLIYLSNQIFALQELFDSSQESWESLANRIAGIPKSNTAMIYKNSNYKKLSLLVAGIDSAKNLVEVKLDGFKSLSNITQLNSAISGMKSFTLQFSLYQNIDSLVGEVEKMIPPFVCVKGSIISTLPKTGKCAKGSTKTPTN